MTGRTKALTRFSVSGLEAELCVTVSIINSFRLRTAQHLINLMGLDSVELIFTVENYFSITITDIEAIQIVTVQDFANCVARRVSTDSTKGCSSQQLFYQLRQYIEQKFSATTPRITPNTWLATLFPIADRQAYWNQLQNELRLITPKLRWRDTEPSVNPTISLAGLRLYTRKQPLLQATVRQFIDWVLALNYKQLLPCEALASIYEIERIIVGNHL